MFLLKGDPLEVLEEKDDWLRIRYYAKTKTIDGWIMRSDVE
jgi:SH3-like domain-containing protein